MSENPLDNFTSAYKDIVKKNHVMFFCSSSMLVKGYSEVCDILGLPFSKMTLN